MTVGFLSGHAINPDMSQLQTWDDILNYDLYNNIGLGEWLFLNNRSGDKKHLDPSSGGPKIFGFLLKKVGVGALGADLPLDQPFSFQEVYLIYTSTMGLY